MRDFKSVSITGYGYAWKAIRFDALHIFSGLDGEGGSGAGESLMVFDKGVPGYAALNVASEAVAQYIFGEGTL